MEISKSEARQLGINAAEMGAHVLRGVVTIGPDGARINETNVSEWLAQHVDSELMLIAAPVGKIIIESELKSCYTCGRDYKGETCPHCAEARARLRG
jgi:hypothetical protein